MSSIERVAINLFGTFVLLSLFGCGASSIQPKNSAPADSAATLEADSRSTTAETDNAETPRSQNPATQLSQEQNTQLSQLSIPILMPTYLPLTFQVTQVDAGHEELVDGGYDYYSILYEGDNNTCLAISSGVDPAMSTEGLAKTTATTALGEATIYTGKVEDRPLIMADLPTQQGHLLRSGLVARPAEMNSDGSWKSAEWCEPVNQEKFLQVLESLEAVQFESQSNP